MSHKNIIKLINQTLRQEGLYHQTSRGSQYSYNCPICKDYKKRLFVHPDRQRYICHNCGSAGSTVTLLSIVTRTSWGEALKVFREYQGYMYRIPDDLEDEIYNLLTPEMEIGINKYVYPLPSEFIPLQEARGMPGLNAIRYVTEKRNISIDDAISLGIGYCAEGKYGDRLILPNYENNSLVYWQGRTWTPPPKDTLAKKLYRKVMNPTLSKEQSEEGVIAIDKSDVLGNIDSVKNNKEIVVTEGFFDMATIKDLACCTHGKVLSDAQFIKLLSFKDTVERITIMFDRDAIKYTLLTAKRLSKYFNRVGVVILPDDRDPNDLGREKCLELINNCDDYSSMLEVKVKLMM